VALVNIKAFLKTINADSIQTVIKWKFIDRYFSWLPRSKLKNRDFSIIGNNCFAGGIYHKFGLRYNSPTVWTYIFPDDYLRFLENLDWYLQQPLEFKKETSHQMNQRSFELTHHRYPIGVLGRDIEIHFMHCNSEEQALEKWNRRIRRLRRDNLFVLFSDGEEYHDDLLERYERLPFEHKIFFSSKPCPKSECTVFVRDYANVPYVFDSTRNRRYERYIDLVKWLNGEENYLKETA
jgi:uncharacterized protein (DUF1919 family)